MEPTDPQPAEPLNADLWPAIQRRLAARRPYRDDPARAAEGLRDPRWEIRAAAVAAVDAPGDSGDGDALAQALHDDHPLVRVAAVRRLGRLGALDAVAQAFEDADWRVREMAALVLAERHPSHPAIQAALRDPNAEVRSAAEAAVAATGSPPRHARFWLELIAGGTHLWRVLVAQTKVIHAGIWLVSAAIMLAAGAFAVVTVRSTRSFAHDAGIVVALATLVCAAAGIAFWADEHHDPGREITLATRTSPSVVLLCRSVLVIGYVALLSLAVSSVLAVVGGASLPALLELWAQPLVTLAALALALTAVAGSTVAIAASGLLIVLQSCRVSLMHGLSVALSAHFWSFSPVTLAVTLVALGVAVVAAQHPRMPEARP